MGKVAVATTNGRNIDGDFSKAQSFYVYDVDANGMYQFLGEHPVQIRNGTYDERLAAIFAKLPTDVEAVLAARIDLAAARELYSRGIISLTVNRLIDKALPIYGRKSKFLKRNGKILRFCGACCGSDCESCL